MQIQADQAGIQLVPHKDILQNSKQFQNSYQDEVEKEKENVETTDVKQEESKMNAIEDTNDMFTEELDKQSIAAAATNTKCSDKVKKGTEIKLPNFFISDKIGTVRMTVLLVQVSCDRCRTKLDFTMKTNQ